MSDHIADIHKELYEVSKAGDHARLRELLEAGADPNKFKSIHGYTALYAAAENGHNEVVKTLIKAKCDLNVKSEDGDTALHRAAENGHGNVVISLLESGAEPNFQNAEKTIPRELAQYNIVSKKYLEGKFDDTLHFNDLVSHAISEGHHELVLNFLEKVPSPAKKGKEDYNNYFHLCFFFFQLIS